jgi:peptide deformylase
MAIRTILKLPKHEKLLRKQSEPVPKVGRRVRALVADLIDTLDTVDGLGLAAPQIGTLERVAVIITGGTDECDPPEEGAVSEIIPLINPQILDEGEPERGYDGCLSIPGLQGYTRRPATLRVRSLDLDGNEVEYHFEGLDARVAHHEIDHLEGVLYLDRIETLEELFYLVEDDEDEDGVAFLPYLDVHPEFRATPDRREGLPTRGVPTIAG